MPHHVSTIYLECNSVRFVPWITHLLPEPVTNNMPTDPGQNGHTPKGHTKKRPQHFGLPKRPQPKGHTVLVKTATQGGSLPKRPHCIWSKRLHRKDHYQNVHTAFGQNGWPHGGGITGLVYYRHTCQMAATRITTKTATLSIPCQ